MSAATAIARTTLRGVLDRRRTWLMVLLAAVPVIAASIFVLAGGQRIGNAILDNLIVRTVLPLIALVFGTSALGAELDDGTAIPLLTKPIDRWSIIVAKVAVAGTLTAALVVPSTLLAGLLMGGSGSDAMAVTVAYAIANLIGSYLYVAIFLVLGVITSRGLIIGLGYTLVWEAAVSDLLRGSQVFSIREYVSGIASAIEPAASDSVVGGGGFLYAAAVLVIALVVGSVRLARYEVRGAE